MSKIIKLVSDNTNHDEKDKASCLDCYYFTQRYNRPVCLLWGGHFASHAVQECRFDLFKEKPKPFLVRLGNAIIQRIKG